MKNDCPTETAARPHHAHDIAQVGACLLPGSQSPRLRLWQRLRLPPPLLSLREATQPRRQDRRLCWPALTVVLTAALSTLLACGPTAPPEAHSAHSTDVTAHPSGGEISADAHSAASHSADVNRSGAFGSGVVELARQDILQRLQSRWSAHSLARRPLRLNSDAHGFLRGAIGLQQPLPLPHSLAQTPPEALLVAFELEAGDALPLDSQDHLQLVSDQRGTRGDRHLKFQRMRAGLPVYRQTLNLHVHAGAGSGHAQPRLTSFFSSLTPVLSLEDRLTSAPPVDAETAVELLAEQGLAADASRAKAVIFVRPDGRAERAWELLGGPLETSDAAVSPAEASAVLISAVTGDTLAQEPLIREALAAPDCTDATQLNCQVLATGTGDDGRTYSFKVFRGQDFAQPVLLDGYLHAMPEAEYPNLFGTGIASDSYFVDLSGADSVGGLYVIQSNGNIVDPSASFQFDTYDHYPFGSGSSFTDQATYGAAVSAMNTIRAALQYYQSSFGRTGINNDPTAPLNVVARVGLTGLNAAWATGYNYMLFGSFGGQSLATAVDVTGHELTHGVISFSSELGYVDQSGALNEALADIFGVTIQAWESGHLDWFIAEDIAHFPPMRNLKNPQWYRMPAHMSEYVVTTSDNGGVHTNMSIPSKAFQLAVDGTGSAGAFHGYEVPAASTDRQKGVFLVAAAVYQALMTRVTPSSQFEDWAMGVLASVDEAVPAAQSDAVFQSLQAAFLATGILTAADGSAPVALTGQITDSKTQGPIAGATLGLTGSVTAYTTTNDHGSYQFVLPATAAGKQATLSINAVGYYGQSEVRQLNTMTQNTSAQAMVASYAMIPRPPATLAYALSSSSLTAVAGGTTSVTLQLRNTGSSDSQLGWNLEPTVDYTAVSRAYTWEDVVGVGTPVDVEGDQSHSAAIPLPAAFPFYFKSYTQSYVSTDGYLTLVPDPTLYYREYPIPSASAPPALVAPYWADLDFDQSKKSWFYYDSSRSVAWFQFDQVWDYNDLYEHTFEVGLFPDGTIRFSYQLITGVSASWARAGIQNEARTEGLLVGLSTPEAPAPLMATGHTVDVVPSMPPVPGALTPERTSGAILGGLSTNVLVGVGTKGMPVGSYHFVLRLTTNDASQPVVRIPVNLKVQ